MPSIPDEKFKQPDGVVGIGASAGGLAAFKTLLPHLPVGEGFSYVLVQHMDPGYPSTLNQILSRYSSLSIEMPAHDVPLQADHLYITPSDKDCNVVGNQLRFTKVDHIGPRHTIDELFASLADTFGGLAVGIVLSGTGSDGCQGAHRIKAVEGLVLVQDPVDAEYPGMPAAVVEARLADVVAPAALLGRELGQLAAWTLGKKKALPLIAPRTDGFNTLLQLFRRKTGFSLEPYNESMLRRRIERRMLVNRTLRLEDYIALAESSDTEADIFLKEILISVTSFFRDEHAFDALHTALKVVVSKKHRDGTLRIWVPGCASGEEAFSIAILVAETLGPKLVGTRVQIFATDVDLDAIRHARKAVYLRSLANGIPKEIREKYLESMDGTYRVRSIIRDMVVFADHDLLQAPPFSRLDLISCRHVLIYFRRFAQERMLALFHYSLNPGGYLLLGFSEGVGQHSDLFSPVDANASLYKRKVATVQPPRISNRIQKRVTRVAGSEMPDIQPPDSRTRRTVFNLYSPPGVLVNERFDLVYIHGDLGDFLTLPCGIVNMNLLEMAAPALRLELRLVLQKSRREKKLTRSNAINYKGSKGRCVVSLVAIPMGALDDLNEEVPQETVVLFETSPRSDESPATEALTEATDLRLRELEQELTVSRGYLQANVENLEVANEELQATNEELQSTTEELQSANEEFQSTNEELQSTNEELQTVNEELGTKSKELGLANADIEGILNTITTAIIVLDQDTRVTRYSAGAKKIADLLPTSIGRPVAAVGGAIDLTVLSTDIKQVIQTRQNIQRELELGNRIFLVRIQPLDRPNEGGLIISFHEETERLMAQRLLRRLASVARDSYDAIIVRDTTGQILEWNRGASRMYGYEEIEARKMNILQIVPKAAHREMLDATARLMHGELVEPYEDARIARDRSQVDVWVTTSAMYDDTGAPYAVSTTERDMAELKIANTARLNVAEAETKQARSKYAQLTSREREILILLVEGSANASSRQIAVRLGISPRTVDTHRRRIKDKMHVHSQADLRHIANLCGAINTVN